MSIIDLEVAVPHSGPGTPALAVRNLTKVFPVPFRRERVVAVRNLSLTVAPGQVYGLLGPNGSGKSTTMKCLLGLVTPSAGTTEIFGRDSQTVESREAVGFLPENPYFYKHLTGAETLRFFGRLCGLTGRSLRERIRELLALVGLETAADRRLGTYSKGMLQRIGLAQALVGAPRLLVLDEPTAGVDPRGSAEIKALILDCKARGITVLLCSHLLGQVQEVCDRVGILAGGVLVKEGSLEELTGVSNQIELVLEGASQGLLQDVTQLVAERYPHTRLLPPRRPQRNLEEYFLDVIAEHGTGGKAPRSVDER